MGSKKLTRRMFKKAVQRGRSQRRGEAYSLPYVEPLSAARTKLEDFFNILLADRNYPFKLKDQKGRQQDADDIEPLIHRLVGRKGRRFSMEVGVMKRPSLSCESALKSAGL